MYLGNDIVALGTDYARSKPGDSRFCQRVFTAEERELIQGAEEPVTMLWTLWAAKEAAYKAFSKYFHTGSNRLTFAHREFSATLTGPDSGLVHYRNLTFPFMVEQSPGWVHVWGCLPRAAPSGTVLPAPLPRLLDIPRRTAVLVGNESLGVRLLACELANTRALNCTGVRGTPPRLFAGNNPLNLDLSLSHDEGFGAVVLG